MAVALRGSEDTACARAANLCRNFQSAEGSPQFRGEKHSTITGHLLHFEEIFRLHPIEPSSVASLPSRGLTRTIRAASPSTAASKTSSWLGGQLPHLDPPCSPTNTRTVDQLYKSTPGGFEHIACRFRSARCHRQPLPQAPAQSHSPSLVKWAASGCVTVRCAAPSSGARQSDVNVAQPRQCGVSAHRRNVPTVPGSSHHYPAPVQAGPTPAASPAARAERRFGARPEFSRCGGHARSKFGQRANRKTRCRSPHPRW